MVCQGHLARSSEHSGQVKWSQLHEAQPEWSARCVVFSQVEARGGCLESSPRVPWHKTQLVRSLLSLRPGRLVWACGLTADTQSAFARPSLSATMLQGPETRPPGGPMSRPALEKWHQGELPNIELQARQSSVRHQLIVHILQHFLIALRNTHTFLVQLPV